MPYSRSLLILPIPLWLRSRYAFRHLSKYSFIVRSMISCTNFRNKISKWTLTKPDTFAGTKASYNSWIRPWQHLISSPTNTLHIREACSINIRCSNLNICNVCTSIHVNVRREFSPPNTSHSQARLISADARNQSEAPKQAGNLNIFFFTYLFL